MSQSRISTPHAAPKSAAGSPPPAPPQMGDVAPLLFRPVTFRGLTLRNRVVVSPMSTYSAREGFAGDFHLVHLGRFALGGAGLVMTEAIYTDRDGRITPGCGGLWLHAHVEPLRRITDFIHACGAAAGVQLGHSGQSGSSRRPWHGGTPLDEEDNALREERPWTVRSASAAPWDAGWPVPEAIDEAGVERLIDDYRAATRRAIAAGFDVVELHCAHGYLLHAFLSPLTNTRSDRFGGSRENRMRLPLMVAAAVREEWPADRPMFVRISAVDGVDVGWSLEDSVAFARALAQRGVDAVACSSGGMKLPRERQLPARSPGFQVPFASRVRQEAGIATIAVGLVREPAQAESILRNGEADLIALGREMLSDPNWAARAAVAQLGKPGWRFWPEQFRDWLERWSRLSGFGVQRSP
jgi:2,4-dienoyl-CoA reductase-like NADH-dependent reductase (Old Yellow Enzyme family)